MLKILFFCRMINLDENFSYLCNLAAYFSIWLTFSENELIETKDLFPETLISVCVSVNLSIC